MTAEIRYRLEVLSESHSVSTFFCEDDECNYYIREEALQDIKYRFARTFVLVDMQKPANRNIAGFFTMRAHSVQIYEDHFVDLEMSTSDSPLASSRPTIEVPLIELMWLARDEIWRGEHFGDVLMVECLARVSQVAGLIGVIGIDLRSTGQGKRLYGRYDFKEFTAHPHNDGMRYILNIDDLNFMLSSD